MRATRAAETQLVVLALLLATGASLYKGVGSLGARTVAMVVVSVVLAGIVLLKPGTGIGVVIATALFSALVRRVFPAPDPAIDVAAILPHLVAAPLAWRAVRNYIPPSVALLLGWAGLTAVVHFGRPLVGLAGWLNLAVPILVAIGIGTVSDGPPRVRRAIVMGGTLASAYAILQYFVPFSWDVRWQENAHFVSANQIGTTAFRPFGPLPSPGAMAVVATVAFLLVVLTNPPVRGLMRACAITTCGLVVMLSQVRTVWVALVAALVVVAVKQRAHAARTLAGVLIIGLGLVQIVPGRTTLLLRAQTFSDLNGDGSFFARTQLLKQTGALASPVGRGIGSLSAGSRAQGDTSIDNGYLVVWGELGIVGMALFVWFLTSTARRSQQGEWPVYMLLLVLNAAGFAIGGITGLLTWPCTGLANVPSDQDLDRATSGPTVRAPLPMIRS